MSHVGLSSNIDTQPAASPPPTSPTDPAAERRQRRRRYLDALRNIKEVTESRKCDYVEVREVTLKIHEWLNADGVIAPAFRPLLARQCFHGEPVGDRIFHDQMRIDLHWLLLRGCVARSSSAKKAMAALKLHGINSPEVKPFLMQVRKMKARVADLSVSRWRQWECIWHCSKSLRMRRNELLNKRDASLRRLRDDLKRAPVGSTKASLSRMSLRKMCDVALAWEIGLLHDPNLSLANHASLYHLVSGDDEVTRHSIRHQREQVRRHIPSCGATAAVRGGSAS